MKPLSFRRRPTPGTVIALIALFVALGGTAEALHGHNSVKSDDIANGAVKGPEIAANAVKSGKIKNKEVKGSDIGTGAVGSDELRNRAVSPAKTGVVKAAGVASSNATTAAAPTDLGGPSVTATVPSGALVEVYARADISVTGNHTAQVDLFEPTLFPTSPQILGSGSNTLQTNYTTPGQNFQGGVTSALRGGWLTFAVPPGTYTFSLRYETDGGTATFQNRAIYVRVIG